MNDLPMHPIPECLRLFQTNRDGPATVSCAEGVRCSSPNESSSEPQIRFSRGNVGPYRFIQNRSRASVTALKSDAATEVRRTGDYSSIKMMVGSAFLGLNIVAVGIVRNVSIIMLAKLSNTINGKYASSMKLLLRTLCLLTWKFLRMPDPRSELRTDIQTDSLRSAPVSQAAAIVRSEGT